MRPCHPTAMSPDRYDGCNNTLTRINAVCDAPQIPDRCSKSEFICCAHGSACNDGRCQRTINIHVLACRPGAVRPTVLVSHTKDATEHAKHTQTADQLPLPLQTHTLRYIAAATKDCAFDVQISSYTFNFVNPGPTLFSVDEFGISPSLVSA